MTTKTTELELEKETAPGPAEQSPAPQKASPLQKPQVRRLLFGAAAVVAIAVLALWAYYRNRVSTDDAQVNGHIIPIASKVYGNVAEVLVRDNQPVTKGEVLVRLDPRDYQAKVDEAQAALDLSLARARAAKVTVPLTSETTHSGTTDADAALAAANANYEQSKLALEQASTAGLAYAEANVQKRQAENQKAQADLVRMKPLAAKDEISQQQYDAFVASADVAKSNLDAAQQDLALAQQTVAVRQAEVASANAKVQQAQARITSAKANLRQVTIRSADAASALAQVEQAQANLEAAKLNLGYTTVVAPEDGRVTNKSVEVGQVLQPGQGMLVLIPLNDVWVTANFKETQLAKVRPADRAEIYVDMYGKTFAGHVDSVAGATGSRLSLLPPENATGNFVKVVERIPVKILLDPIPPEQAILRPGMNVEATIITK
ncbi:MAG TPA: HlyD family secretion protein [Candidatus Acidoferrales bacterium]|nr:HlyD family secretion protein [Candidatus Acidoferrales bacterium]